jgi:hypothetical protein
MTLLIYDLVIKAGCWNKLCVLFGIKLRKLISLLYSAAESTVVPTTTMLETTAAET